MEKAKEYIRQILKRRQAYYEAKHERQLRAEADRRIQVREFEDDIYVSIDGIPLLLPNDISERDDICDTIANMRDRYVYYKMEEYRKQC